MSEQQHNVERHAKSQPNLAILSWMGLACQFGGVGASIGSLAGWWLSPASAAPAFVMVVFGMALGGWAGNLSQINELKRRVAALEDGASKGPGGEP